MKRFITSAGMFLIITTVIIAAVGSYKAHNYSIQLKPASELHEVPERITDIEYVEVSGTVLSAELFVPQDVPLIRTTEYVNLTFEEMELLERIAMAEAEGEDTIGKALVMRTVLNRSLHDGMSISEVIYRQGQFATYRMYVEPTDDCHEALAMIIDGWTEKELEKQAGLDEYIPIRWFSAGGYPIYGQHCFQYGGHCFCG